MPLCHSPAAGWLFQQPPKPKQGLAAQISNLTEAQSDVLEAVEGADGWITTRDVVKALLPSGEEYDSTTSKAALIRKGLKRLEVLGLIETQRVGNDRSYRGLNPLNPCELNIKGSTGSTLMDKGVSLVQPKVQPSSTQAVEPPTAVEPVEPPAKKAEPGVEPPRSQSPRGLNQLNHPPFSVVQPGGSTAVLSLGSGADAMDDDGDDPHWPKRQEPAA